MRTVSSAYLQGIYQACVEFGAPADELAALVPGGTRALSNSQQRFAIGNVVQLLAKATQITGREDIGIFVGKSMRPQVFGDTGQALLFCSTLRHAMDMHNKYLHLTQEFAVRKLEMVDGKARISWISVFDNSEHARALAETAIISQSQIGLWLCWPNKVKIHAVQFSACRPELC